MRRVILLVCALLFLCALPALASPGGTDGSGGHYDSKTGEYHFHHGYPAHQHINGVCPYDPSFTSPVITGGDDTRAALKGTGEDADDSAVASRTARIRLPFQGIPKRGQKGLIASGVVLSAIALGGFLSTVHRQKKD